MMSRIEPPQRRDGLGKRREDGAAEVEGLGAHDEIDDSIHERAVAAMVGELLVGFAFQRAQYPGPRAQEFAHGLLGDPIVSRDVDGERRPLLCPREPRAEGLEADVLLLEERDHVGAANVDGYEGAPPPLLFADDLRHAWDDADFAVGLLPAVGRFLVGRERLRVPPPLRADEGDPLDGLEHLRPAPVTDVLVGFPDDLELAIHRPIRQNRTEPIRQPSHRVEAKGPIRRRAEFVDNGWAFPRMSAEESWATQFWQTRGPPRGPTTPSRERHITHGCPPRASIRRMCSSFSTGIHGLGTWGVSGAGVQYSGSVRSDSGKSCHGTDGVRLGWWSYPSELGTLMSCMRGAGMAHHAGLCLSQRTWIIRLSSLMRETNCHGPQERNSRARSGGRM